MGIVLRFPEAFFHEAASRRRLSASRANVTALNPASIAAGRDKIADHQSAGMKSRCHHFDTCGAVAWISKARASRVGQSSIAFRKDLMAKSVMPESLGLIVLNGKANMSYDKPRGDIHPHDMADKPLTEYEISFIDRTKWARQSAGLKQREIAEKVGLPQDHYKHFESERTLPNEYVGPFCDACNIDANWLFTTNGKAPALSREAAEERMPSRPRKKAG